MGRFGGHEMSYASDADVLFVFEPVAGVSEETATRAAHAVAEELRGLLARPGPDPSLHLDADLRPEGKQGPLVRTLAAYRAYYDRWASPWEVQALHPRRPGCGGHRARRCVPGPRGRDPVPGRRDGRRPGA